MLNTKKIYNSVRALIQSILGCKGAFPPLTHHYVTKKKGAASPLTVNNWTLGHLCASAEQTVH